MEGWAGVYDDIGFEVDYGGIAELQWIVKDGYEWGWLKPPWMYGYGATNEGGYGKLSETE